MKLHLISDTGIVEPQPTRRHLAAVPDLRWTNTHGDPPLQGSSGLDLPAFGSSAWVRCLEVQATSDLKDPGLSSATAPPNFEIVGAALRSMACREVPVHLYSIARELGVSNISVVRNLDRPGHVAWVEGSPSVQLKEGTSPSRRRFALAHELAHVVLRHGAPESMLSPMTRERFVANERMADRVAGALLLPPAEIEHLRDLPEITLQDIRDVAERQQVSLSVVVNRLRFGDPRPALLLTLRRNRFHWEIDRVVGGVNGLDDHIYVLADQFQLLEELPAEDMPMTLHVRVGAQAYRMSGTGNRRGSNVLALVNHVSSAGRVLSMQV